jgi:hypothetical protein
MAHPTTPNRKNIKEHCHYEIRIKESIDPRWASWFEGMTIRQAAKGETILSGPVVDKSSLHGIIAMIGELNLTLLSVVKLDSPNPPAGGKHKK